MAHKPKPVSLKTIVNVAVGAVSLAALVGCIWALLSGLGALVAHATIWVGGKPEMWSMFSMVGIVDEPTYPGIAFGFLFCLLSVVFLATFTVTILAVFGKSVLGAFRQDAHP